MSTNYFNPYQAQCVYPNQNPNAVSINIVAPQAYGNGANCATNPINPNGFYSLYGHNTNPTVPYYPMNYNNNIAMPQMFNYGINQIPQNSSSIDPQKVHQSTYAQNEYNPSDKLNPNDKTTDKNSNNRTGEIPEAIALKNLPNESIQENNENDSNLSNKVNSISETNRTNELNNPANLNNENVSNDKKNTKKITPLTNEYVQSLENYMNDPNAKIRLIGAKELLERFKEDENRKDNPSLMPLLNKALRDPSPSVRFLALTALQLDYALGNDETVTILKEIQSKNQDKIGEDSLLASEILLKMVSPHKVEVPMTQAEIERSQKAAKQDKGGK